MLCERMFSNRFMKTPEKLSALRKAHKLIRARDMRLRRMKAKLDSMTAATGVQLEGSASLEIEKVVGQHSSEIAALPASDLRRYFGISRY